MRLLQDFYAKTAVELAPLLLGKVLCRNINGEIIKKQITETEAYYGESDTACHAHKGKTERTKVLYEAGGITYVYLCYGIHNLLNVVTGSEGFPQAVLIRGVEGYDGPGKLTKALQIDRSLNGVCLLTSQEIWIEDHGFSPDFKTDKRVGINYASEEDINRLWRFLAIS